MLRFDRKQQSSVKQLSFNKKKIIKKSEVHLTAQLRTYKVKVVLEKGKMRAKKAAMSRKYLWDFVTGFEEGKKEKDMILSLDSRKNLVFLKKIEI